MRGRGGQHRRLIARGSGVLLLALAAAACSQPSPSSPIATASPTTSLAIGVLVPLTGPAAQSGRGALESVRQVVALRSPELTAAGLDVEVVANDDRGQQSVGQQQATILADTPGVIGVIGSTESGVDEGVQPILARSGLLTVSLGGSEPALTRSVPGRTQAFSRYLTLSAQRLDRPRVAASLVPASATTVVLRGSRREDASMATTFARSRAAGGSPAPVVRRIPDATTAGRFDPALEQALQMWLDDQKPGAIYVIADAVAEWATILAVRDALPRVPIITDEDVLRAWPDAAIAAEAAARTQGSPWGPLRATTTGATPPQSDVDWPLPPDSLTSRSPDASPGAEQGAMDEQTLAVSVAIDRSRYSIAAHDAAQALVDGVLVAWSSTPDPQRTQWATANPEADPQSVPLMMQLRARVAREVRDSAQEGLLGAYTFDRAGVASRRLIGVYGAAMGAWTEEPAREVVGNCGTGSCVVRRR